MLRTSDALMSLSDVASVAQVQRPVVSMWRKRHADTSNPFPAPAATINGTEHFSADDVAAWFSATGKGNNPQAALDTAARVLLPEDTGTLTAMLALRALAGQPLGALSSTELLDLTDELDPDDELLMRQDIKTDWTDREDVRTKLRTSIKRLLVENGYPPDRQQGAIMLMMATMAGRYAGVGR